jgi:ring-1,2-phenylacetyl-CoA epoxidase subunit PaaE
LQTNHIPLTPKNFFPLVIKTISRNTADSVVISFDIPTELKSNFLFKAGQYVTVHAMIKGESVRRSYSICSSPHSEELSIGIKKVEGGIFSTFANHTLKIGDTLDVMAPMGNFLIKNYENIKRVLLVAAGSGITPMMSHIHHILEKHHHIKIDLLYGNKTSESTMFRHELEDIKDQHLDHFSIHKVFTREKIGVPLLHGRLDKDKCSKIFNIFLPAQAYDTVLICGPNEMIFSVKDALLECGLDDSKVHYELFNTAGLPTTKTQNIEVNSLSFDPSSQSQVTIKLDGELLDIVLDYGGKNILDAALDAGADLPYACKGGVCSTCKAKVIEGKVDMELNYALEPDEIAAGYVLTCQSHPRTDKVLVDFDQKS